MVDGILHSTTVAREAAGGYSSLSEIPKTLKAGSLNTKKSGTLRFNVKQMGEASSDGNSVNLTETFHGLDIFDIDEGGKTRRIAFGSPSRRDVLEQTKDMPEIIPMSPFDISGLSRQSKEGQQMAYDFANALAATEDAGFDTAGIAAGQYKPSQVSALLYAGSRGDETAMAEFQKMVEIGRQRVAASRAQLYELPSDMNSQGGVLIDPLIKRPNSNDPAFLATYAENRGKQIDDAIRTSTDAGFYADDVTQTDTSNLFLFHEKPLERGGFEFDADGNLLIRPAGDFQMTESGLQNTRERAKAFGFEDVAADLTANDPEARLLRRTIHLGLQGPVDDVVNNAGMVTGRVVPAAHAAMFRLDDAIEANPGSLDNLAPFDTFMTPAPGKPLMIPKGKFKILTRAEGKGWTADGVETTVEDTAVALGADREKFKKLKFNMSAGPTQIDSERALGMGLKRVAAGKYGVAVDTHDGTTQAAFDLFDFRDPSEIDSRPIGPGAIASVSRNWASSFYDNGIVSGLTTQRIRTNINKEAADKLGIIVKPYELDL
jgi:hypothetical protein